jgi:hypothetical protein
MPVGTEMARLRRSIEELAAGVEADLRSRRGLGPADRRSLRSEIEECVQLLDELRNRLAESRDA